ncbi:hypothetical protein BSAF29S_00078 [Bacillus safensis subsp. safensis]
MEFIKERVINMFFSTNELQHKDTLAIGLFQKSQLSGKAKEMDELLEGRITELLKEGDISSKRNQLSKFHPLKQASNAFILSGLGRNQITRLKRQKKCLPIYSKSFIKIKSKRFLSCWIVYWKGSACSRCSSCPF